ncbi:MAG TPA: hypothetical protein VFJ02_03790 [Vicinamibacterales bacterium]|nr:hypothetical protein [Vicinamibacterales bacterium]
MGRVILRVSIRLLNVIRALLLSAGVAGLAATAASWLFRYVNGSSGSSAAAPFQALSLAATAAFLVAAVGFSALMPSARDLVPDRASGRGSSPLPVVGVLVALALLTTLQGASIAAWWTTDRTLLAEAMGTARDPMGLHLIPTVILLSLPALAAIGLVTFMLTSFVGICARADRAAAALAACVLLQGGCVGAGWLALHGLRRLGSTVQSLIDQSSDPTAAAQVSTFLMRHDAPAADVSWRLIWLLGGYTLAVVVAAAGSGRRQNEPAFADSALDMPQRG